jgi:signal transduction histidine kinase
VAKLSLRVRLVALAVAIAALAVSIMGVATVTEQRVAPLRRYISTIEREINRFKGIVRDVLSFARPTEPRLEVVSAMDLLRDVRDLVSARLSKANIESIVEESADPTIQGDPDQLKQVLLNLIRNGADSIGEYGKIVLRESLRGRSRHAAILEVKDHGKGIPLEAIVFPRPRQPAPAFCLLCS